MPRIIREPIVSSLLSSVAEDCLEAQLPHAALTRAEVLNLEAALTLAPGSRESVLEASRRIEGVCRWAYLQMGRRRTLGILQVRRAGVRESDARAWVTRGRVTCP